MLAGVLIASSPGTAGQGRSQDSRKEGALDTRTRAKRAQKFFPAGSHICLIKRASVTSAIRAFIDSKKKWLV